MNNLKGVQSIGIKLPIIRKGDNLVKIVSDSVLEAMTTYVDGIPEPFENRVFDIHDKDVIGITESIVARAQGNYVTIDEIVYYMSHYKEFNDRQISKNLVLYSPIMSRNRFSMILKAFARYADSITIIYEGKYDEQGNPNEGVNPFTGVDIKEYYRELCESENCKFEMHKNQMNYHYQRPQYYLLGEKWMGIEFGETFIDCRCHPEKGDQLTLKDFMKSPILFSGWNNEYGLLGSNKATEEKIKLFPLPVEAQKLVEDIQKEIFDRIGKHVEVMVYGDGCFKDPVGGIWEWADPVVSPAYTKGLEGTPNEIKIKAFADDKFKDLNGEELTDAIKSEIKSKDANLIGNMASQGTTPRRYVDLLGSLMDLTSGSGDKGTPVVLVKNYFNNFAN